MTTLTDDFFEDIRPYRDHEIRDVMMRLVDNPAIVRLIRNFFPGHSLEVFKDKLISFDSIFDFQLEILQSIIIQILKNTTDGFSYSGVENIDPKKNYLFISNHRDITLDPSLITKALVDYGFMTPEVAIGDNLIQEPWIRDLLRLTKSFIVKRNLPVKELMIASKKLSQYIHYTLTHSNQSVWIAQREGRAKDGNDVTQPGLFSMLGLSAKDSLIDHFIKLNITPVSISYEYDPCDTEKAHSLYANRFLGGYKKRHREDEESMKNGIMGYKGRININFGIPINGEIQNFPADEHKNETITRVRHLIDDQIIDGYKLWPTNYIAYDLYMENSPRYDNYTKKEWEFFIDNIEEKLNDMGEDREEMRKIFYEMYARPVINKNKLVEAGSLYAETNL